MKYLLFWSLLIPSVAFSNQEQFVDVEQQVKALELTLSATIGVTVFDTETHSYWNYNGDVRFPLTSTFKTIACAKLLYDSENGQLSLAHNVNVKQVDLVAYSPIIEKYVGDSVTLNEACFATMSISDNTAANIIIKAVGGTQSITGFVRTMGDEVTRLDRMEPDLNEGIAGDERDTTTPNAISKTLNELLFGETLSLKGQQQLKNWMMNNQVTGNLLRSVLPVGWNIADRSGAGGFGARSITALVWSKQQTPIIISIYLAQTEASIEERNEAIVQIGRTIFNSYHPISSQ